MNVVIAANRNVPLDGVEKHLTQKLAALPMDATIVLRRAARKRTQPFERMAASLAESLGMEVAWEEPQGYGRQATWQRDWRIVKSADKVLLYLHESHMDGGTEHLLACALADQPQVEAFTMVNDNAEEFLAWLGDL